MRQAAPLLVLAMLLAGCTDPSTGEDAAAVRSVGGVAPDARGDVNVTAGQGVALDRANGSLLVRLGDVAQLHVLQACAGECIAMEVPRGSVVANTALISLRNVSLNAIGPEGDSAVFFYDDGRETGRFLRWSDVQSRFQMNADLLALGNLTATGHVGSVSILTAPNGQLVTVSTAAAEGFERSVYARGVGRLVNGTATVTLPPEFVAVTTDEFVTVQVTPSNPGLGLYVTQRTNAEFTVRGEPGANGAFDWFVQATRLGNEAYSP